MKSTTIYKTALSTAFIAGAFAVFIAINMTVSNLRIDRIDPVNSVALEQLRFELRSQPDNEVLKDEIRQLDLLARKAYFSNLEFTAAGATLLLIFIGITIAALKIASNQTVKPPDPGKFEDKDESLEVARQARESLVATLIIVAIVVLFALLSTTSPIDFTQGRAAIHSRAARTDYRRLQSESARQWPAFRGPNGVGVAHFSNVPLEWDGESDLNIVWKSAVPRRGFSSPIVWGDRIFLTAADAEAREVICYDAARGELLWRAEVGVVPGMPHVLPEVTDYTTYAASTPATNGEFVFAVFGTGNLAAFDFDGNMQWVRHLVSVENIYGHSSSLITYEDKLFVQFDDDNGGRVFAIDGRTGRTIWKAERELQTCWSSPIIAAADAGPQLVVAGHPNLKGYDIDTGAELWRHDCLGGEVASSPAFSGNRVFAANEFAVLTAVELGDPIEVIWEAYDDLPDVSSPLAFGDYLLLASGFGAVNMYNASDGELLWTKDFDEGFYSSPLLVGDNIYLMDKAGTTHVFAAGPEYREIAVNPLGEIANTIPAIMDGRIYIRGENHLYCIGLE